MPRGGSSAASRKRSADYAPGMTVTLLRHSGTKRVLYMEAGKDFVDLLLSFLLLPVGTILSRLADQSGSPLGAIANVAGSVAKLADSCLYVDKSDLLIPKVSVGSGEHISRAALLQLGVSSDPVNGAHRFYSCSNAGDDGCGSWRAGILNARCPDCKGRMSKEVWMTEISEEPTRAVYGTAVPARKAATKCGFVKKNVTFIVTDDLEVSPASTIKSINLLNNLKVGSMSELESCEERVGAQEALKLLAASFNSKNVLNNVFGPRVIFAE